MQTGIGIGSALYLYMYNGRLDCYGNPPYDEALEVLRNAIELAPNSAKCITIWALHTS